LRRGEDDIALEIDKFFGEVGKLVKRGFKNPGLDDCILTVDVPGVAQRLNESYDILILDSLEEADPWKLAQLLCARRERPGSRRAAEERDEVAPSHWPAPPVLPKG
jgi:hypothetical protein